MYSERSQSSPRGQRGRSGHVFFCLPCFLSSPVADSVHEPESAGSKQKLSSWLSSSSVDKKKKKTLYVNDPPPLKAAAAQPTKASSAETRSDGSGDKYQHRERIKSKCSKPSKSKNEVRSRCKTQKTSQELSRRGTHAPLAGLCIMMAALAILVFSGRAAAVICLSSCFYILQLARAPAITDDGAAAALRSVDMAMASNEHRKSVVLEGFLERNNRPSQPLNNSYK